MSDLKMSCPSCGARTSAAGMAAIQGDPCPSCGNDLPEPKHCPTCTCRGVQS